MLRRRKAHGRGQIALRVVVDEKYALVFVCQRKGKIQSGGCLTDAAFLIGDCNNYLFAHNIRLPSATLNFFSLHIIQHGFAWNSCLLPDLNRADFPRLDQLVCCCTTYPKNRYKGFHMKCHRKFF